MIRNLLICSTLLGIFLGAVHCGPPPMPKGPPPEYEEPPAPSWLADAGVPDSAPPQ